MARAMARGLAAAVPASTKASAANHSAEARAKVASRQPDTFLQRFLLIDNPMTKFIESNLFFILNMSSQRGKEDKIFKTHVKGFKRAMDHPQVEAEKICNPSSDCGADCRPVCLHYLLIVFLSLKKERKKTKGFCILDGRWSGNGLYYFPSLRPWMSRKSAARPISLHAPYVLDSQAKYQSKSLAIRIIRRFKDRQQNNDIPKNIPQVWSTGKSDY